MEKKAFVDTIKEEIEKKNQIELKKPNPGAGGLLTFFNQVSEQKDEGVN